MTIGQLENAMNDRQLVYAVDIHDFDVKKPDDKKKKYNKDEKPIEYIMPIVIKMYVTKIDALKDNVHCILPLDDMNPLKSKSYIDYGKRRPSKIYETKEQAEKLITPELIKQYITQDFVTKYPQIADVHPVLKDIFDVLEISETEK